jgi:hypothetical protein
MTEHTPGPWRVGYEDSSGGGDPDDYNEYFIITSVPTDDIVVSGMSGDCDMKSYCYGIEDPANAHLIAAAPELLEALEQSIVSILALAIIADPNNNPSGVENGATISRARAVIAKARKGPQHLAPAPVLAPDMGEKTMYKIVRHYYGKPLDQGGHLHTTKRTIATGLTLEEAQAHCGDPETSSRTCTSAAKRRVTRQHGEWFDGFQET